MTPLTYSLQEFAEGVANRREVVVASELEIVGPAVELLGPVALALEVARAGDELRIRGEAELTIRQPCVRCLAPVERDLSAAIAVLVRMQRARESEDKEPPSGVLYFNGENFSLADEVRQALLVEIPPHPLCSEACRGLCPRCGKNRNRDACGCDADAAGDPRWADLRRLAKPREDRGRETGGQTEKNAPAG